MTEQTRNRLDLNLLTVFLEVFRLRSITRAAESLEMTQPGVSGALKRLQDQLKAELFVREGRGISPTHVATQLANEIGPAFGEIDSALGNIKQFDPSRPKVFKVLVNEMALVNYQPLVEADLHLGNVTIQFAIAPSDEEKMLQQLSMQKADLAIDLQPNLGAAYKTQSLFRDEIVVVAREGHPRIVNAISQSEFYQETHITLRLRRSNKYAADVFTKESLLERKVGAECDSMMSMMALVSTSDCIGTITRSLANRYASRFGLNVLELPFETFPVEQHMIWHSRTQFSPAHKWLRERITSYQI
ncbi:LysR family transcriptional regulator [Vibrio sp. T187]|uniref:LysR family transcriptional regulator n=1 Tax=Vibrio TaxID=662 RepID=UPI0010C9472B|nr:MULTISPECIES: LysR family transcriptional regulator [Vibrio]MBW3695926.1 LysR family transcriptional regulator [Vibrio sp. T187]